MKLSAELKIDKRKVSKPRCWRYADKTPAVVLSRRGVEEGGETIRGERVNEAGDKRRSEERLAGRRTDKRGVDLLRDPVCVRHSADAKRLLLIR